MRNTIGITAMLLAGVLHVNSQDQSNSNSAARQAAGRLDSRWTTLVGEWGGEGTGSPGNGAGSSSFQFDLQKQVLVRRSHSEYPPSGGRPATVHDDLMVIYPGTGEEARANYFDNEGHVIEYTAKWSGNDTLTFISKPTSGTPQFRLIYKRVDVQTMTVAFEMAPPGQAGAFRPYVSGKLKRKGN